MMAGRSPAARETSSATVSERQGEVGGSPQRHGEIEVGGELHSDADEAGLRVGAARRSSTTATIDLVDSWQEKGGV
jgi:hypothetical protein